MQNYKKKCNFVLFRTKSKEQGKKTEKQLFIVIYSYL